MLKYDQDLETVDGRYQVPDHTIVEHNVGCTLAMTTTSSSTESQRAEEYESKVSMSAEFDGAMYSGAFSASADWSGLSEKSETEKMTKITSSADCVKYQCRPRIKRGTFTRRLARTLPLD